MIFAIGCGVFLSVESRGEDEGLTRLRAQYQKQLQLATEPVTRAYIRALDRLQGQLTKANEVDLAVEVLEEKQRMFRKLADGNGSEENAPIAAVTGKAPENESGTAGSPSPSIQAGAASARMASETTEAGASIDSKDKHSYSLVGTKWIWSASDSSIVFHEEGRGRATFGATDQHASYRVERKGPRKFLIVRTDGPPAQVMFEVLADGETAVFSNLTGSLFKRMVSRIPTE